MKIVCIGDSLTYGFGLPRTKIFTHLAAEKTGWEIINAGINGDSTGGMLARFQRDVIAQKPEAVFIMGGGNDIFMCGNADGAKANICALVHQAFHSKIKPILGVATAIYREKLLEEWTSFIDFELMIKEAQVYREWLLQFGKTFYAPVVDFYPVFDDIVQNGDAKHHYLDGLHPNARGHALLAEQFCAEMPKHLRAYLRR